MSAPNHNNVDLDALLDFTEYDNQYTSPSLSPATSSKPTFASPITVAATTPNLQSTTQSLSGPSHNYDMYRQQTGFVPGAIANTMAVNQTNNTGYQDFGSLDYVSTFSPENDLFDFNTSPSQNTMGVPDLDMSELASPDDTQFFSTINPSSIEQGASQASFSSVASTQPSNVGRLWPGAHSQAAIAKAQAQQRQQQHVASQQVQRPTQQQKSRGKAPQPSDPIVEQKITQLLNSMRAKPAQSPDSLGDSPLTNLPRSKKEEEEMDEDERLLASEEGKKLSSKERRQLRNKVSARAFRSRRKEYISQLEGEIASKVNENGELRAENRALLDENKRLTDLTRMLLSSPSFSNFLDHLSTNPSMIPAPTQVKVEAQQQQEQRQVSKDVSPYGSQPSQQQIGMAMIPEHNMDFSMLTMDNNTFNFQPQVFVVDTPDLPASIDTTALSGKTSNFVEQSFGVEGKAETPVIERPVQPIDVKSTRPYDEEFESNPDFALFHAEPTSRIESKEMEPDSALHIDDFGRVVSDKSFAHCDSSRSSDEGASAAIAMARLQCLSADLDPVVTRLERLTMDI